MDGQQLIESMQLDLMVKGAADAVRLRSQAGVLRDRLANTPLAATVLEVLDLLANERVSNSPCLYETLLERLESLNQAIATPGSEPLPLLSYDLDISQRVLDTFIDEANEHLDACERGLLALEEQPGNQTLIDDVFRDFHSLKGETATVGLAALRGVAHVCEDLLHRVRGGGAQLSGSETDYLLIAIDLMRSAMSRIAAHVADASQALPVMPPAWRTWRNGPQLHTPPPQRRTTSLHKAVLAPASGTAPEGAVAAATPAPAPAPAPAPTATATAAAAPALVVRELQTANQGAFPVIDPATGVWLLAQAELGEVLASADRSVPATLNRPENATAEEQSAQQAVRVPVERIDIISGQLATALVLAQQLDLLTHREGHSGDQQLNKSLEQLTTLLRQLQGTCLALRLVKVADTFSRVRRTARDIARQLGKHVEVHLSGEEVELDKTVLDGLSAPLMHLVRNALDHGLETPNERRAAGKPESGRLVLEARREGRRVVIEITEDGRGLNLSKIRDRALSIGLLQPQQQPTREELIALIFLPGFSTAKEVSDLSGRGVGMDVVRQAVQALGGTVTVRTDAGKFTTFLLHLPISLALQDTLLVRVGAHEYLLPQTALAESVRLRGARVGRVHRLGLLLDWRGTAIPLLCLHDFAGGARQPDESMNALIVRHGTQHFALAVDEVVGMRNVLIRPLGEALSGLRGFVGGSLMEDGRILLVLDPLDAMRAILGRGFAYGTSAAPSPVTGDSSVTGVLPVSA